MLTNILNSIDKDLGQKDQELTVYKAEFEKLKDWMMSNCPTEGSIVDAILAEADNRKTVAKNYADELDKTNKVDWDEVPIPPTLTEEDVDKIYELEQVRGD
jgi:hypothetical protein